MGASAALDYSRPYLLPPDSPPELASPGAQSYSSRSSPSTEQAWEPRASATFSMSGYEKSPAMDLAASLGGAKQSQDRPSSTSPTSSRQRLPSLSSLFGPPSSMRHLRSPTERDSNYLSYSPLERPRPSPSLGPGSFTAGFPRATSPRLMQPRTYDAKFDPERQGLHAFARSFTGPRSPSYADRPIHGLPASRSELDQGAMWSNPHEFSFASREPSLRSPRDSTRHHLPGSKESSSDCSDNRPTYGGPHSVPKTASALVSGGVPSKDGLGPKIWTGTHFLPRFVRATEVPGEGMCYFYDDGSHCKTVIDGEAVNAHWGVTKAGKPRKRLAIACVTCREKKIKCDPDYPRCVQCEKFGRVCKFKNAPRGGHNTSPSTPPAELDDVRNAARPSRQNDGRTSDCGSSPATSPQQSLRHQSPESGHYKRLKVGPDAYISGGEPSAPAIWPMDHGKSQPAPQRPALEILPRIPDEVLSRACRTDPYGSDPESISAVLTQFFGQIDNTMVMRFFPEMVFRLWAAGSTPEKSAEDLMVLYSVLAVGVALAGGPKHIAYEYAQVAYYAQKTSVFPCLQLVQSRILLAVYHISTSSLREANELITSAATAAASLQLNQELDKSADEEAPAYPLGMNGVGYREARRRTLWSLFMLERINMVLPDRPVLINADDIYVRLPADSESFEKQAEAHMPVFDPDETVASKLAERPLEITGYLVEMVHIWSSCQSVFARLAARSMPSGASNTKARNVATRAREWRSSLPPRLVFGGSNLESAAFSGKVGSFLTMHLLYHHALIQLNRFHVSVTRLPSEARTSYLQECRHHALSILDITNCLDRILRVRPTILSTSPPALSVPIIAAVDVLTACGPMASINELIQGIRVGKTAVDSTAKTWEHSQALRDAIDHRLQTLIQIYHSQGSRSASPADGFRVFMSADESNEQMLVASLPGNHDLGFGAQVQVPVRDRFSAFFGDVNRVDVVGNHTIVSVDTVSLSADTSSYKDSHDLRSIYGPVNEFLGKVQSTKRRAVQKELRAWHDVGPAPRFSHKVEHLGRADVGQRPNEGETNGPDWPTILLTHVPLYRDTGTPCGPHREHWPPTKPPRGQSGPVSPDHGNAISVSAGYQYQNVLSQEDSAKLVESVGNVTHVFSGDDHDYCELVHSESRGRVREITVKSFSMAMGVPTPGFVMASLYNPVGADGKPVPGAPEKTLQTHLCLLPNQMGTYVRYAAFAMLTLVALAARALLVPILHLQPFALEADKARAAVLPVYQEKAKTEPPVAPPRRAPSRPVAAATSGARNGPAATERGSRWSSKKGRWGWAGEEGGPRIKLDSDFYDGGKEWKTAAGRRVLGTFGREMWTTTWRTTWMAVVFWVYLARKG